MLRLVRLELQAVLLVSLAVVAQLSDSSALRRSLRRRDFPAERPFNACTPTSIRPMYVGRKNQKQMCLAYNGVGTVEPDGQCTYYHAEQNSVQRTPTPECYFQYGEGIAWQPAGAALDRIQTAPVQAYITDPQAEHVHHYICRSTVGTSWFAGWMRFNNEQQSPLELPCYLSTGDVAMGQNVEILTMTTRAQTPLWDAMQPRDFPDPSGLALNEGVYTLFPTAEQCEQACYKVAQCGGFVYYRGKGWCWLKNKSTMDSVQPIIGDQNSNFRSKRIEKASYAPFMGSCTVLSDTGRGQIVEGNNLAMGVNDLSGPACCDLCKQTAGCAGVSFLTFEWKCFLHSRVQGVPYLMIAGDSVVAAV